MKTSLVVASILLAGVALEVAAYRINSNENQAKNNQWVHSQQESSSHNDDGYASNQNNKQSYERMVSQNIYDSGFADRSRQNSQNYESAFESSQETAAAAAAEPQYHANRNQAASAGLTRAMIEKIAAFQKIAQRAQHFDHALSLNKNVIKLSEHNFVTFYNATMKHLDDGVLEYLYISPERDTVLVQYQFDEVKTVGSFKSNVHNANAGYFDVVMSKVNSTVSTGFDNEQPAAIGSARFQFAEAAITTEDGAETQVFDGALKHRYLGVLEKSLSAEVARSVNCGVIAQMKNEIREPAAFRNAENKGKLFDMAWKEDDVSMEMHNVGFQNPGTIAEPMKFCAVSYYRKSENVYRMRYHFALNDLEWTSPLTVEYAGNGLTIRSASVKIDEINVHVTVTKSYGQQQSCGQVHANIEVSGLRYNFDENVPSEIASKVENKLQRFLEHSFEYNVQESLKQELCNSYRY